MFSYESNKQSLKDTYLKHVRNEILIQINDFKERGKLFNKEDLPLKLNSYERNLYLSYLSNEYLIECTKYYISNAENEFRKTSKYIIDNTYNETLKHKIIHILIKRLENIDKYTKVYCSANHPDNLMSITHKNKGILYLKCLLCNREVKIKP